MKNIAILLALIILTTGCSDYLEETASSNRETFLAVCEQVDQHYSFFTYTHSNWDSIVQYHVSELPEEPSDEELFTAIDHLLNELNDGHTNVYTPNGIAGNTQYFSSYLNNTIDNTQAYFSSYEVINQAFDIGSFNTNHIAYLKLKSLAGDDNVFEKIDSISTLISESEGLIIDVRDNRGGNISNSEIVVYRFTNNILTPCKYRYRNGREHNDFSTWQNYTINGSKIDSQYNKPIAILTNRITYSAAEWFVFSMKCLENVNCIGDTTGGGSAKPIFRELPNGWMLRVSNTQCQLPPGNDFQNIGLKPDIPLWLTNDDLIQNKDAIIERAILWITNSI